jgi:hypothetical protein
MKATARLISLALISGFCAPNLLAQAVLNKTTLGQSQNGPQDLANSLIVNNKPKVGKGEKKEEVDPKKLVSKKSNDTTFSGSLNDIGLDWTGGGKLGKPQSGGEADSKHAKQSESPDKDLKASKISDGNGESQTKEQKPTTSKPDEKSSPEKEKASSAKSDGDR